MDDSTQKRILIVEDDQFLREFYQELLSTEGYLADVAEDGEVASTKIYQNSYDLILLDIMLPKKDGLQVLKDMRSVPPKTHSGKLVMLTNLGQDTVIKEAFNLGAAGYIIKSAFNPDQVLNEIRNYLKSAA